MLSITPSLPAQTFEELKALAVTLQDMILMLQIDIVDGKFVPNISWPFTEAGDVYETLQKIKKLPSSLQLEFDCMVMNPEQYIDTFVALGVRSVIIHMGSTEAYEDIIMHARTHGYQIGFAITNDVPLTDLTQFIDQLDFVQVMGIAHVGKQGEPFDTRTLDTLRTLRAAYPKLPLAVDGAVNADTLLQLRDAGATRFAPGSAIAKSVDPSESYKQLSTLLGI
jgi:ribulose-phosphate 3-epimerase